MKYTIVVEFLGRKFRVKISGQTPAQAIEKLRNSLIIHSVDEYVEPIDQHFKKIFPWL